MKDKKTVLTNGVAKEGDRVKIKYYHAAHERFFSVQGELLWDEQADVFRVWDEQKDGKSYNVNDGVDGIVLFGPEDPH